MPILLTFALGLSLAFAESGLGLGMLVPGETAVVVLAATMRTPLDVLLLGIFVTIGACLGDHVGYLIGRRFGESLRDTKVVSRLGRHNYDRAVSQLHRRGGLAVFMTRLVPILRTLTPAAAGVSGLEYRRFLPASLAGSALWAGVYVGGGSVIATMMAMSRDVLGDATWLLLALLALAVIPTLIFRASTAGRSKPQHLDAALADAGARRHGRTSLPPLLEDLHVWSP